MSQIARILGTDPIEKLCSELDPEDYNLILLFNEYDVASAYEELEWQYENIPKETKVMSFDTFIYLYFVKPFNLRDKDIKATHINFVAKQIDSLYDNVLIDMTSLEDRHWPIEQLEKRLTHTFLALRKGVYDENFR